MVTQRQIIETLRKSLGDVEDGLETDRSSARIAGVVISPAFDRLNHKQRQDRLWRILEKRFGKRALVHVGPIATLTPVDAELKSAE